ncbi:hypothetical protein GCK72_025513 [Caenorhabditis remanei]|uniref:Protein kinase domain-containing protein n=1 Tax=Caenorhabditis remanei TaxID=31234 RepID=A0A6A5G288_CAERE|nr:hypothetical protein GCK72_025513 [Caenorhabditis remanei]KAF1749046.1 hypothetical protein GCK72_025513 [Caenorhabditis remanei]
MVRTKGRTTTKTKPAPSDASVSAASSQTGVKIGRTFIPRISDQSSTPIRHKSHHELIRQESESFRIVKAEYYQRVRNARKVDPRHPGAFFPICYSAIGPACSLETRPLSRLPHHIISILNDHYVQLTHGLMVPEGDLYNNGEQQVEKPMKTILNEAEYNQFIQELEEEEKKKRLLALCSTSNAVPQLNPYNGQYLVNGEMIGCFVIYGSGSITRAVCSKTREVFTAHVLPAWKVTKVIDVIQRLQVPADRASFSPDEIRMSEICVSRRLEIVKSNNRWVIFNPFMASTIHSYASEQLDEMTEQDVMSIFAKLVQIVRYCHSRKVLIRNFRPKNFYLKKEADGSWTVRPCNVQDMGCEDEVPDPLHPRRTVFAAFMAPEMLKADCKTLHTRGTEIWGLGILLYILLIGKYPFHEKDMTHLFRTIKFKTHKWPFNFISTRSRAIVNNLLRKVPANRMSLSTLSEKLNYPYPNVRCRSNLILKQQDLIVKMDLFDMYYNNYKNRLLPQNVNPINEEYLQCEKDLPISAELARRDLHLIEESIKTRIEDFTTGYEQTVMDARVEQINRILFRKEIMEARIQKRVPNPVTISADEISKELLLPTCIYPVSQHYHPSHSQVDWFVFTALRDANALEFPKIKKRSVVKSYPAPVFRGVDISQPSS